MFRAMVAGGEGFFNVVECRPRKLYSQLCDIETVSPSTILTPPPTIGHSDVLPTMLCE